MGDAIWWIFQQRIGSQYLIDHGFNRVTSQILHDGIQLIVAKLVQCRLKLLETNLFNWYDYT